MNIWEKIRELVEDKFASHRTVLSGAASVEDIEEFQKRMGVALPDAFKEIYMNANGQKDESKTFFFGMKLLSLSEIEKEMKANSELIDVLAGEGDMCFSTPAGHIKCQYVSKHWIPIFSSRSGAYVGLDFDPGPEGVSGQVINFGTDDENKFVLSKGLDEFLDKSLGILVRGKDITYNEEQGFYGYTELYYPDALSREMYRGEA